MPGARTSLLLGLLALAATTALPSAAADASVDPDPDPPPLPDDAPPPHVGALWWAIEQGGEGLGWTFAEAGWALGTAFEVAGCTLANAFGSCPYVIVADETGSTYYLSAAKHLDQTGVWQETNGCEGLQRSAVDCRGGPATEPADRRLV